MDRRTIVVEGPLAFRMRRLAAAQHHEAGVDIITLPLVAARLGRRICTVADAAGAFCGHQYGT